MGKIQRRSKRLADRADALDFYQQLQEAERQASRSRRRGSHHDEEPFGESHRRRNRRSPGHGGDDLDPPEQWEEAS